MLKLPEWARRFVKDRRIYSTPSVPVERRTKTSRAEADSRLHCAVEDLEKTLRLSRDDLLKK